MNITQKKIQKINKTNKNKKNKKINLPDINLSEK